MWKSRYTIWGDIMNLDPVDIVLMTLRIAECSGQPFLFLEHLIRESKRLASSILNYDIYSAKELRKSICPSNLKYFYLSTASKNLKVCLTAEGVSRADELLGTIKSPQDLIVQRIEPFVVTLKVVYNFAKIDTITYCRHYFLVDVCFIRRDTLEIVDDPREGDDATGIIRVISKSLRRERVIVNKLSHKTLAEAPRIATLLQFSLQYFDKIAKTNRILAETLAGLCAIKNLFGCKIHNKEIIWNNRTLF